MTNMQMQTSKPRRTLEQIMSDYSRCAECGWEGEHRDMIHTRLRGYVCPHCQSSLVERVPRPKEAASIAHAPAPYPEGSQPDDYDHDEEAALHASYSGDDDDDKPGGW